MYFFSVKTARFSCDFTSQPEEENFYFYFLSDLFFQRKVSYLTNFFMKINLYCDPAQRMD